MELIILGGIALGVSIVGIVLSVRDLFFAQNIDEIEFFV